MFSQDLVLWLSSVCDVMTDPSTVANLPAVMLVQPYGKLSIQSDLSTCEFTGLTKIKRTSELINKDNFFMC